MWYSAAVNGFVIEKLTLHTHTGLNAPVKNIDPPLISSTSFHNLPYQAFIHGNGNSKEKSETLNLDDLD